MRRILATLFAIFAFAATVLAAPVKILDVGFDNSDKIIQIKSAGELMPKTAEGTQDNGVSVTKGFVQNPDRVYFDISNSMLSTPSKMWSLKNSILESAKISQFGLNPHVVRLVLTYKKGVDPKNFEVYTNNSQIIIKYTNKKLVENTEFKSVYKSMPSSAASLYYDCTTGTLEAENTSSQEEKLEPSAKMDSKADNKAPAAAAAQYKLNSQYYVSSVNTGQKGIIVGGFGQITMRPALYLSNPDRMVLDIENAVLAPALRNRSFFFEAPSPQSPENPQRDILRLGQFEKNVLRLVVEGAGAKNYRAVVSLDLQNIFIAKRPDVINSKLTTALSSVLTYSSEKSGGANVLGISFSSPAAFSAFEEGSNFYLDIQNVSNINQTAFDALAGSPDFANIKSIKIAADKTRLVFPLEATEQVDMQVTDDAKRVKIYFKVPPKSVIVPAVITASPPPVKDDDKEKPRPSTIKSLYRVVVDPGHGGSDVGATRNNIYEKDITLDISNMVVKNLNKQNVFTDMTREKDRTVELSQRTDFSNEINPDLFVSIHVNASVKEDIYGIETHWWKENSVELANAVHAQMTSVKRLKAWETINRGLFKSQFYVINHTECPAILVEIGFISNPAERNRIIDKKNQEEIAEAIAAGIMDYLKKRSK